VVIQHIPVDRVHCRDGLQHGVILCPGADAFQKSFIGYFLCIRKADPGGLFPALFFQRVQGGVFRGFQKIIPDIVRAGDLLDHRKMLCRDPNKHILHRILRGHIVMENRPGQTEHLFSICMV